MPDQAPPPAPTAANQTGLISRLFVLVSEVGGCGAIIAIVSALLMSDPLVGIIDRYRPYGAGGGNYILEKHAFHIEALGKRSEPLPRVAIVGASPLMAGVDSDLIDRVFQADGVRAVAHNNGIPHFSAYELPIFTRSFLTANTKAVVYLYSIFAFGDEIIPQLNYFRWNTVEMLRILQPSWLTLRTWTDNWIGRFVHENLAIVRYHEFFRYMALAALKSDLVENLNHYDYDLPDLTHPSSFDPLPISYPERLYQVRRIAAGGHVADTIGYRGLIRFCTLAKAAGIPFILVPMPEADFGRYMGTMAFSDVEFLDLRVRQIGEACGATVLPRSFARAISATDDYWYDYTHGNRHGREAFSILLAHTLKNYLKN